MIRTSATCLLTLSILVTPTVVRGIVIDPELFSDGADISNAFAGAALSAIGSTPTTASVFVNTVNIPVAGNKVFGHDGAFEPYWGSVPAVSFEASLRVDFNPLVTSVSVDFLLNNGSDPWILQAFNSGGILLASDTGPGTSGTGNIETGIINRPAGDIAFVVATAQTNEDIFIDRVLATPVPEPHSFAIGVVGLATLWGCGDRKRR